MATLVYHAGGLGDFITALPAIGLWKRRNPGERLVLLGSSSNGRLALDAGRVDGSLDVGSSRLLPLFREEFSREAGMLLGGFSTALVFSGTDSPLVRNIRRSSGIRLYHQPPFPGSAGHVVDYHLSLLAPPETLSSAEKTPRIVPSENAMQECKSRFPAEVRFAALHPGSGSTIKQWPLEKFIRLANHLRSENRGVVWIKGPAEERLQNLPRNDRVISCIELPLLAALLRRSCVFVGSDSGVAHLAAAVGCPTVALFGPSDPAVWAPRGERVSIIYKKKSYPPCHGPGRPGPNRSCAGSCLADITVEEVFAAAEAVLR